MTAVSLLLSPAFERTVSLERLFAGDILFFGSSVSSLGPLIESTSSKVIDAPKQSSEMDWQSIQSALQGDGEAYRELVDRYQALIAGRMWKFTRDRAAHEELVQDVFVETFFSLAKFRASAPFEHWLQKIATRVGYRFWKSRKSNLTLTNEQQQKLLKAIPAETPHSAHESAELVHYLLAQLCSADRLVITLMSLEGCSVAETARQTGWPQTLVKVRAYRARRKIESIWQQIERRESGGER